MERVKLTTLLLAQLASTAAFAPTNTASRTGPKASAAGRITLTPRGTATFDLLVDGAVWLPAADPPAVRSEGTWFVADGKAAATSLVPASPPKQTHGTDALGAYIKQTWQWRLGESGATAFLRRPCAPTTRRLSLASAS